MSKERLSVIDFGRRLIEIGDLDPVYVAVEDSGFSHDKKCSFHLGWMMYYHAGLACWLADRVDIFKAMLYVAKRNDKFKRGSQRKHHRNEAAIASAHDLIAKEFGTATRFMEWSGEAGPMAVDVFDRIMGLVGWGPCFAWRIPDILDRNALFLPCTFVDRDVDLFFSNPKRGALLCCDEYGLDKSDPLMAAHLYVMEHLGDMLAPPRYERPINVQETETVFCKWKSHMVGHYDLGRDTLRSIAQLKEYNNLEDAQRLLETIPDGKTVMEAFR